MSMEDEVLGVWSYVCQQQLVFKQFLQAEAVQILQIDSCRILSVILVAKKFGGERCEVLDVRINVR